MTFSWVLYMKSIKGGGCIIECLVELTHGSEEAVLLYDSIHILKREKIEKPVELVIINVSSLTCVTILKHTLRFTEKKDIIRRPRTVSEKLLGVVWCVTQACCFKQVTSPSSYTRLIIFYVVLTHGSLRFLDDLAHLLTDLPRGKQPLQGVQKDPSDQGLAPPWWQRRSLGFREQMHR